MRKSSITDKTIFIWIILFCLTHLVACNFLGHSSADEDGPPSFHVDASQIPNAVPKKEPLCAFANKSYSVRGHYYRVLKSAKGYDKRGIASWYGSKFNGKLTSTMERFNYLGMTAANTELPLPTYVQVTNLNNGRKIIVKVNDRGPFEHHRLIDLSYAAAKKLDFADKGTAPVRVVAINPATWHKHRYYANSNIHHSYKPRHKPEVINGAAVQHAQHHYTQSKTRVSHKHYLQVGAFKSYASAKALTGKIAQYTDAKTHILKTERHHKALYRVRIGPVYSSHASTHLKDLLAGHKLGEAITVSG